MSTFTIELARAGRVTCRNHQRLGFTRVMTGAYAQPVVAGGDQWAARRADWLTKVRAVMALYADKHPVLYGPTALQALNVALPHGLEDWRTVHLLVLTRGERPRRQDVAAHVAKRELTVWRRPEGLPVLHPVDHWVQLGAASDDALVEVGDGFVRRLGPLLTPEQMWERLDELAGVPGIGRARRAMRLVRPGTDSLYETRTRLTLWHAGLPEPAVNPEVWCPRRGRTYHVDLGYRAAKVAVEFDGLGHTVRDQMDQDADRRRHLQDEGWLIFVATATRLREPAELTRSVENALILRQPRGQHW
ncbi:MAG: hypothetical protein LBI33_09660 [Propionibacteriaceae bacterium]|jgi:hypothetical protein|nr:hypothetical protein [Propionibacteriaceae bacterium]